jgi:hypothetical protein
MESRKIRRLEIVSDKIEGGDSKREVIRIRFDHPTKKNEFVWSSPWEAAMAGLEAPCELTGEGKEKGKERRGRGARPRGSCRGAPMEGGGAARGGAMELQPLFSGCCFVPLAVREEARRRKEKRRKERRKRKGRERKEKKYGKIFKLENF